MHARPSSLATAFIIERDIEEHNFFTNNIAREQNPLWTLAEAAAAVERRSGDESVKSDCDTSHIPLQRVLNPESRSPTQLPEGLPFQVLDTSHHPIPEASGSTMKLEDITYSKGSELSQTLPSSMPSFNTPREKTPPSPTTKSKGRSIRIKPPLRPDNFQMSDRVSVRIAAMISGPAPPPRSDYSGYPSTTRTAPGGPKRVRASATGPATQDLEKSGPPKRKRRRTEDADEQCEDAALDPEGDQIMKTEESVEDNVSRPIKKKKKSAAPSKRSPMPKQATPSRKGKEKEVNTGSFHSGFELQISKCHSQRYEHLPRCFSCIRKITGETCRFIGIRSFRVGLDGKSKPYGEALFGDEQVREGTIRGIAAASTIMVLPTQWNIPLDRAHISRLKATVAKALLPALEAELEHTRKPEVIRRRREIEVRATCDHCMTSMFSECFVCKGCGREICNACREHVTALCLQVTPETRRHNIYKPLVCTSKNVDHGPEHFLPVTRFAKGELEEAIEQMRFLRDADAWEQLEANLISERDKVVHQTSLLQQVKQQRINALSQSGFVPPPWSAGHFPGWQSHSSCSPSSSSRVPALTPSTGTPSNNPSPDLPLLSLPSVPEHICKLPPDHKQPIHLASIPPSQPPVSQADFTPPIDPSGVTSLPIRVFNVDDIDEPMFRPLWAAGEALVIRGLKDRFKLSWSPEYFMEKYKNTHCSIIDCETESVQSSTVGHFFKRFGQYEDRKSSLKLKDWPPQSDFKTTFPELFEDFHRAVPIPNYTRRDGVLNLASHFPVNAVAPDIGPKMYNALESSELPGGKGSTRLHMDMADAVNIMLYASDRRDGTPGTAVWDIFRAEDSAKLRQFFHKHFPGQYYNDPIHSQVFYLDSDLRKQLFDEQGVASWRIYQRPGEAVFIPAGCAHQVCNLADCIKVAVDFVSPENVDRCERLTREFREQNQTVAWKEDILQLRSMMWYAWLSCRELEKKFAHHQHPIL